MIFSRKHSLWMLLLFAYSLKPSVSSSITIENSGYHGIVVAINPTVSFDPNLISSIKKIWTDASQLLFEITKKKFFFASIKILVPKTWNQSKYKKATVETYDSADVIIADPNPLYRNQPYVLQFGGCGLPGSYIHLTPEFLLEQSLVQKHKAIVHEWAHYRWGVFDEYPTANSPAFYFNQNGEVEATRCPVALRGMSRYVDQETGVQRECQQDSLTGLPEEGCRFFPYETQPGGLNASLTSYQFLQQVNDFCTSDRSNLINRHNMEAPTEQNRLCNLRSVWDVIMSSPDFANGLSPRAGSTVDTRPSFEVLQPESYRRYVLVLDTSGSMIGNRLKQMRQAVSIFISQFVRSQDEVAIIKFNTAAEELSGLRKISNISDQDFLLNAIPSDSGGSSCIGCGIEEAIKILERDAGTANGGIITVFTDGPENGFPTVAEVKSLILKKRAIVNAIFFVTQDNEILQKLAIESGGSWFQLPRSQNSETINDVFCSLAASRDGDISGKVFEIYSKSLSVTRFNSGSGEVQLDGSLGESTTFIFAWSNDRIEVILESPSGCLYSTQTMPGLCPDHVIPVVDGRFKTVTLTLPGVTQTGKWKFKVTTQSFFRQQVTVTVTSKADLPPASSILIRSEIDKHEVEVAEAVVVFAQVSQNSIPILGATVYATIESPKSKQRIQLLDNGSGSDVRKNDGIYSRYFSEFDYRGRYSVQIKVTKEESKDQVLDLQDINQASRANLNFAIAKPDGSIEINHTAKEFAKSAQNSMKTENFSRIVVAPGFEYMGTPRRLLVDDFPPNRITDLTASLIRNNTADKFKIKLLFSAPGSDFDHGKAAFYEIRYSVDNLTSLIQDFKSNSMVDSKNITSGNLFQPQEVGTTEIFVLDPPLPSNTNRTVLGFSIQAFDKAGNFGPPSNIAPVTYILENPKMKAESFRGGAVRLQLSLKMLIFHSLFILFAIF